MYLPNNESIHQSFVKFIGRFYCLISIYRRPKYFVSHFRLSEQHKPNKQLFTEPEANCFSVIAWVILRIKTKKIYFLSLLPTYHAPKNSDYDRDLNET